MTEYGFLQALSYFKCVSGSTGFRGSTFGAFKGLFEEVAGCDDTDRIRGTVCWAAAYMGAKLCGQCFHVLSQCDECDDESVTS